MTNNPYFNPPEPKPEIHAELRNAGADAASGYLSDVGRKSETKQQHSALWVYRQRPGLDGFTVAGRDPICVRCERMGVSDETDQLCLSCRYVHNRNCPTEFHDEFRDWAGFRPDLGVNCSGCNLWLPARVGDATSPAEDGRPARFTARVIEIGLRPMAAFKGFLSTVLNQKTPATAAALTARVGESKTAIQAGDTNALYTAALISELVLNQFEFDNRDEPGEGDYADMIASARLAILRVSNVLLARS